MLLSFPSENTENLNDTKTAHFVFENPQESHNFYIILIIVLGGALLSLFVVYLL